MISEERLLDLWAADSGRPVTLGKNRILAFARAVEAEARREALEEAARVCESVPNDWDDKAFDCAATIRALTAPRFANVSCSQCGREFGPGDHGYSHCKDHAHLRALT